MGQVWCEGYQAWHKRLWRHQCPYPADTLERELWLDGWLAANRDPSERSPQCGLLF